MRLASGGVSRRGTAIGRSSKPATLCRRESQHDLVVEARTKTAESLEGKPVRDADYYTDPMSEVIDLTGIRVVVYYSHSIPDVADVLHAEFDIDEASSVDHSSALPTDRFGYRSRHFALRIDENRSRLTECSPYRSLVAEVQVRTGLDG